MTAEIPLALVTGASGWLGLGLCRALTRGLPGIFEGPPFPAARLRGLLGPGESASQLAEAAPGLETVRGDVTRPETLEAFFDGAAGAVLFHCAGLIHPRRVRELQAVNVEGSAAVWSSAARAGVRRAVIMSSNSPCGVNPHPDHLFDEQSPYEPYMAYGRSKMLMEKRLWSLSRQLDQDGRNGPETVLIRAPWFYGPFQPPRQTEFFVMIRDGRGPLLGRGLNRRSMTYLDNLAQGLILAALTPEAAGRTYWLADRRPYAMTEILDTVERVLEFDFGIKCRHKRLRLPSITADVAYVVDWMVQGLGFYNQKFHVLSEMNKTIACSIAKAERELGYRPQIELEEGLRRSVAWLLEQPAERAKLAGS
jgi:nucleoside-diphosphate-sugar epimerase